MGSTLERLAPLLQRLAEKRLEHPKTSFELVRDANEALKGRGNDPAVAAKVEVMADKIRHMWRK